MPRRPIWRALFSRKTALVGLVLALAPATWLRTEVGGRTSTEITVTAIAPPVRREGPFAVLGLWQLTGMNENFGGYSALALLDHDVRLYSDKGWLVTMDRPDKPGGEIKVRTLLAPGMPRNATRDIESVTYNRQTGQSWVGYENHHTIYRYAITGDAEAFVRPAFARRWGQNSGIEAMVRLADGRFVVLREIGGEGYLYPGDPVEGAEPMPFRVAWPDGYNPTDMAELPDGRVVILLRRLAWRLPVFESRLVVADPASIDPDEPWQVTHVLQVEDMLPRDNYEGLAVESLEHGAVALWLVSDDNISAFQHTLLAKVRWNPESAGEQPQQAAGQ